LVSFIVCDSNLPGYGGSFYLHINITDTYNT